MINKSKNDIVFNCSGIELHELIKLSLGDTALILLKIAGKENISLDSITTKSNGSLIFSKFVLNNILKNSNIYFNEEYINSAYVLYMNRNCDDSVERFYNFVKAEKSDINYRRTYTAQLPRGIGSFLIRLHSTGAITLPAAFNWPSRLGELNGRKIKVDIGKHFSSDLLSFLRTLESQRDESCDSAFDAISHKKSLREWFTSYGTKLLLATGWHKPEDANLDDLLELQEAKIASGAVVDSVLPFRALIDVLWRKYKQTISFSPSDWDIALKKKIKTKAHVTTVDLESRLKNFSSENEDFEYVLNFNSGDARPNDLKKLKALPGLSFDLISASSTWLNIQELYLRKTKRESYNGINKALGFLNIYLFLYLPYWFERHPDVGFKFPNEPSGLIGSVFVSRLVKLNKPSPKTLMEMMDAFHLHRGWKNNGYYSTIKQIEIFFEFIVHYSNDIDGCIGFKQPISKDDYPATNKPYGTNKHPVPRRLIGVMLDYILAIVEYSKVITEKIISREIEYKSLIGLVYTYGGVIDTFQLAKIVGFIPLIIHKGILVPLKIIPNCLCMRATSPLKLKNSNLRVFVPHPHALNQIYVALCTGLRHNHIQWLDARTFDQNVSDEDIEFTQLFVNTDKRMDRPWEPHVNMAVIRCLRSQLDWRNQFDEKSFEELHYYNNNPNTKWEKIMPLFSFDGSGKPHSDGLYEGVWKDVLCGLQGLFRDIGEVGLKKICSLEPPGVDFNDLEISKKKKEYGSREDVNSIGIGKRPRLPRCQLIVKSKITPHSTRVTVVSELITFLPSDIIGKYITGQTSPTVNYYYVPNPNDVKNESISQHAHIFENARQQQNSSKTNFGKVSSLYTRADEVNSNLSKSLKENLKETLDSYGCISISLGDGDLNGRDLLLETGASNAAENKTEICPYGNICPSEVVKLLGRPNRCGLCPMAVRSVDHLQAVSAKIKQMAEVLDDFTVRLEAQLNAVSPQYTNEEFDQLENERSYIAQELTGWQLSEEVLYQVKNRLQAGKDSRRWVVQKPEVIVRDLKRVVAPTNLTAYTLKRLEECVAYPSLESPQIRARFDIMRRQLLARCGDLCAALSTDIPINPAGEFAGLLRSIIEANNLSLKEVVELLESEIHLINLPNKSLFLLEGNG